MTQRPLQRLCARCGEELREMCWVCESRPATRGRPTCRRCENAMQALARYWRVIGMPLLWTPRRRLRHADSILHRAVA